MLKIQNPLVGSALQRLFGLQGRVSPHLEESVIPTVLVGDISQGGTPDVRRAAISGSTGAAVAAEFTMAELQVPVGTLVKIEAFTVWAAAECTALVSFANQAVALVGVPARTFTDRRLFPMEPVGVWRIGTSVAAISPRQGAFRVFASSLLRIEPKGWLIGGLPANLVGSQGGGGFFTVQLNLANTAGIFGCEWTEYPAF